MFHGNRKFCIDSKIKVLASESANGNLVTRDTYNVTSCTSTSIQQDLFETPKSQVVTVKKRLLKFLFPHLYLSTFPPSSAAVFSQTPTKRLQPPPVRNVQTRSPWSCCCPQSSKKDSQVEFLFGEGCRSLRY